MYGVIGLSTLEEDLKVRQTVIVSSLQARKLISHPYHNLKSSSQNKCERTWFTFFVISQIGVEFHSFQILNLIFTSHFASSCS